MALGFAGGKCSSDYTNRQNVQWGNKASRGYYAVFSNQPCFDKKFPCLVLLIGSIALLNKQIVDIDSVAALVLQPNICQITPIFTLPVLDCLKNYFFALNLTTQKVTGT